MGGTNIKSKRINWLDWMKAIGMYLIVYGHFMSYGHQYIYTFSVPLFFIISGFLFKKEEHLSFFLKKNFHNLIIPMLIMVAIIQLRKNLPSILNGSFQIPQIFSIISGVIAGNQKILETLWFVHTLFIIKLLQQLSPKRMGEIYNTSLFVTFTAISITLSYFELFAQNAIINTFLSYQFFYIGYWLKKYKTILNEEIKIRQEVILIIVASIITFICCKYNGNVWCFRNDYGKNFVLYLIGGLSGSIIVFAISKLLQSVKSQIIQTISNGSIIILGLHYPLIRYFRIAPELDFISALTILILFVPIINICAKYAPFLIGTYRKKREREQ